MLQCNTFFNVHIRHLQNHIFDALYDRTTLNPSTIDVMVDIPSKNKTAQLLY